ncbi:MAG: hypothetical protein IPJ02_14690 [Chitinophagaceae bacterium]|nr:hypothetical protein [Chitinophagaceae bacterium]
MKDGSSGLTKEAYTFLNAVAERLLGVKQADVQGRYSADVAVSNDLMRTLQENSKKGTENICRRKGELFQ